MGTRLCKQVFGVPASAIVTRSARLIACISPVFCLAFTRTRLSRPETSAAPFSFFFLQRWSCWHQSPLPASPPLPNVRMCGARPPEPHTCGLLSLTLVPLVHCARCKHDRCANRNGVLGRDGNALRWWHERKLCLSNTAHRAGQQTVFDLACAGQQLCSLPALRTLNSLL
jgi:hypothetical protein